MRPFKSVVEQQNEAIKKTLLAHQEKGASLKELITIVGDKIEVRTLQRRLKQMLAEGVITKTGGTKNARYYYQEKAISNKVSTAENAGAITLTGESKKILSLVLLPTAERKPVGYNRAFLDDYQPNQSQYLSEKEIDHLTGIGKKGIMNGQPAGTYASMILNRLLIDLSWNSSRLEGNTYSLLETERFVVSGIVAAGKSNAEMQMILNHKQAIEFLVRGSDNIGFNRYTILNLHALLSNNLLPDPSASGRLRMIPVAVQGSVYLPPALPQVVEELFDSILGKAASISNPFEQAFFEMVQLPYLQPFEDVNKRVSRLASNIPFIKENLTPLSFVDVPRDLYINGMIGIYELNNISLLKDVFMWAYERSAQKYTVIQQSLGEPDSFKLEYREVIGSAIKEIVSNALNFEQGSDMIIQKSNQLPETDRLRFVETMERELYSLHEGNIARYWITPAEFGEWQSVWRPKRLHVPN